MTFLQVFRRERTPLVALAALAFGLRILLVILGTALAPAGAEATGFSGLCISSSQAETHPDAHDPLLCNCGPVCSHGCSLGTCLNKTGQIQAVHAAKTAVPSGSASSPWKLGSETGNSAIRGPPSSLV